MFWAIGFQREIATLSPPPAPANHRRSLMGRLRHAPVYCLRQLAIRAPLSVCVWQERLRMRTQNSRKQAVLAVVTCLCGCELAAPARAAVETNTPQHLKPGDTFRIDVDGF